MTTRLDKYKGAQGHKKDGETVFWAAEMGFFTTDLRSSEDSLVIDGVKMSTRVSKENVLRDLGIEPEMTRQTILQILKDIQGSPTVTVQPYREHATAENTRVEIATVIDAAISFCEDEVNEQ